MPSKPLLMPGTQIEDYFPLQANSKAPTAQVGWFGKGWDPDAWDNKYAEAMFRCLHAEDFYSETDTWDEATNWGFRCGVHSGLNVLDVDPRHGGDESLAKLVAAGFPADTCPMVRTASGGQHLYFRSPVAVPVQAGQAHLPDGTHLPGLDSRGEGGYVVAPGSCIDGNSYVLERRGIYPTINLSDWVLIKAVEKEIPHAAPTDTSMRIPPGQRRQAVLSFIGSLYAHNPNLYPRQAATLATEWFALRCEPDEPSDAQPVGKQVGRMCQYVHQRREERKDHVVDPTAHVAMTIGELRRYVVALPPVEQVCGPFQTASWVVVYGAPGAGKTRLLQAMAYHIGRGENLFGWGVPRARSVYYLDAEMSAHAIVERSYQFASWPENITWDIVQRRDDMDLAMFELGNPTHTQWVKEAAGSSEVIIIDNVEATLIPSREGIWSPVTWAQTKPLRDWAVSTNRLLIFVDHDNAGGSLAGSQSKQRGAWMTMRVQRLGEPGETTDKLRFSTRLVKPPRNDLPDAQLCGYDWTINQLEKWSQKRAPTIAEQARELHSIGVGVKEICEALKVSKATVYRAVKK